jgi:hypothetical protein
LKTIGLELEKVICNDENTEICFYNIKNSEHFFLINSNNKLLIPTEFLEFTNFILNKILLLIT